MGSISISITWADVGRPDVMVPWWTVCWAGVAIKMLHHTSCSVIRDLTSHSRMLHHASRSVVRDLISHSRMLHHASRSCMGRLTSHSSMRDVKLFSLCIAANPWAIRHLLTCQRYKWQCGVCGPQRVTMTSMMLCA
jgi:hypothetical protein